ncbi:MAG TPA: hypothetical protein VGW12_18620 [Pyrinomonadaceae bacterium]|nr:hypothetical protein [Pyrinomonadaceae bacterium]
MSETENIPQDQDYPEEEPSTGGVADDTGGADPGDLGGGGSEGDPPIIIQRTSGSSVTPG